MRWIIRDNTRPEIGTKVMVTKFAWFPVKVNLGPNMTFLVWLEKYNSRREYKKLFDSTCGISYLGWEEIDRYLFDPERDR